MRDYGMSISKTCPEVIRFQIRVVREDCLRSFPLSKQTKNQLDGDTHASNDRFTAEYLSVYGYASEKFFVDHSYSLLSLVAVATISLIVERKDLQVTLLVFAGEYGETRPPCFSLLLTVNTVRSIVPTRGE